MHHLNLARLLLLWLLALPWMSLVAADTPALRALIMETEPWGFYQPETGELQGIWVDIARAIEAESGIPQQKKLAPYARVMESLRTGDADLSYLIRSPDRDAEVIHAGFLFDFGSVVLARKGVELKSYEDLQGLRIGVMQSIRLSPRFDQDQQLNKIPLRNYETMLNMLQMGRLDAVSGNSLSLSYLAEKLLEPELLGDRLVLQLTPVTLQFSVDAAVNAPLQPIQDAVLRLRERGDIAAILDSWAGTQWRVDSEEMAY